MTQRSTDDCETRRPATRHAAGIDDTEAQLNGIGRWTDLVRAIVDAAPPVTEEQRTKLQILLCAARET
jgi:hypothetical protein